MFNSRGLSRVRNKIKRTWLECGSIVANSIEELAFMYDESNFSEFIAYLNRLEQVEQCISLVRNNSGNYVLDYLKWNDNHGKRQK